MEQQSNMGPSTTVTTLCCYSPNLILNRIMHKLALDEYEAIIRNIGTAAKKVVTGTNRCRLIRQDRDELPRNFGIQRHMLAVDEFFKDPKYKKFS